MPPINRQFGMVYADKRSMKIAFASSGYRHVDQYSGATSRPVVYGVRADWVTLLRVVEFPVVSGHQTEKVAERIHALEDCVTLFCMAIDGVAFRQLLQVDVRAKRVPDQITILGLLQEIQSSWYEKAQYRSARQRDSQRSGHLLEEPAWREEPDPLP